jgi:hypothetical protein
MKKTYIAGPMTGLPDYNFPAFFEAEKFLSRFGKIPLNPARNPKGLEYADYMDISMSMVRAADELYVLKGWEDSNGACAEVAYAKSIGKEIVFQN